MEKRNGTRKKLNTEFSIRIVTLVVVSKMKKGVLFIMAAALALLMGHSRAVWAVPVMLDLDQLDAFIIVSEDDPLGTPVLTVSDAATTTLSFTGYTVTFPVRPSTNTDVVTVDIGLTGQSLDFSAFTSLDINMKNTDENVWGFGLFIEDGSGVTGSSGQIDLVEDTSSMLSLDFSTDLGFGFNLVDVDSFGIRLTADFSVLAPLDDIAAEYKASPAPEPSTLLLLGSGLAGLGFFRRRKKAA